MSKKKRDPNAVTSMGRYPVLSQVRAFPGLFAGILGAVAALMSGIFIPQVVASITITETLVVATPLAGLTLGLGIGRDGKVSRELARRLQLVGFVLLIIPHVTGLATGPESHALAWISVAALAVVLVSIAIGQRLPGAGPQTLQS